MMDLSIIIPAYNAEKYIKKCLDSVCNLNNTEIIVVNDGSTDSTKKIVEQYKNVKLINNDNHGVSYSRNCGIKESSGKYIMFLDADDFINEKFKFKVLNNEEADIIYFSKYDIKAKTVEELYDYVCGITKPCIAGPYSKLFKKKFIEYNNIKFDENIINGEDMLFNLKCLNNITSFKIINTNIYKYRIIAGSATKKYDKKIIESDLNFQKELNNILSKSKLKLLKQNEIKEFALCNAIKTLIDRMAYLNSYFDFKKNIKLLDVEIYNKILRNKIFGLKCSKKTKLILFFIKIKQNYIVYKMLRRNHNKYKNCKESFIEI